MPDEELFYPNHHSQVDEYLTAVASAGATLVAALDIPYQLLVDTEEEKYIAIPGALVLWAKKAQG